MKGQIAVYRLSRGRVGHRFPGGPPMPLLDHVGAKSGTRRTTPLVYVPEGEAVAVDPEGVGAKARAPAGARGPLG